MGPVAYARRFVGRTVVVSQGGAATSFQGVVSVADRDHVTLSGVSAVGVDGSEQALAGTVVVPLAAVSHIQVLPRSVEG